MYLVLMWFIVFFQDRDIYVLANILSVMPISMIEAPKIASTLEVFILAEYYEAIVFDEPAYGRSWVEYFPAIIFHDRGASKDVYKIMAGDES